jgi:hypothetical protein
MHGVSALDLLTSDAHVSLWQGLTLFSFEKSKGKAFINFSQ